MQEDVLIVVDENLTGLAGHWYAYDKLVLSELSQRGIRLECWVSDSIDDQICSELKAQRVFSKPSKQYRSANANLFAKLMWCAVANWRFFCGSRRMLRRFIRAKASIFIPNTDLFQLYAIALLVRIFRRSSWLLLIRESMREYIQGDLRWSKKCPLIRQTIRFLKFAVRTGRVKLCSDSEIIAGELRALTGLPCISVPVPYSAAPDHPGQHEDTRIVISILGSPRAEKGADLIPSIITRSCDLGLSDVLTFRIQGGVSVKYDDRAHIVSLPPQLDSSTYARELECADIGLLPYRVAAYHARTSGLLIDYLAAGKPVVVTQNTWLEKVIEKSRSGLAAPDGDPLAYARCIAKIVESFTPFTSSTQLHATSVIATNAPSALAQAILSELSPASQPPRPL